MKIDIGIFAYNEEQNISHIIKQVAKQSILNNPDMSVRIVILANGCIDQTVNNAQKAIKELSNIDTTSFEVLDLPFKGKAKTWNHFVHQICRSQSNYLVFMDADITLHSPSTIFDMINRIDGDTNTLVVSSHAIKDLKLTKRQLTLVEKIISSSGASAEDYAHSICGQLYAAKKSAIENIFMPCGLPVEDGYLRAMILTNSFEEPEKFTKIESTSEIWHSYESISTIKELIQHQTRIVIGSAINSMIFEIISSQKTPQDKINLTQTFYVNELWLQGVLKQNLPKLPYGYVPFHFLVKRLQSTKLNRISKIPKILIGFIFDCVVYINATIKMARGKGANHW